MTKAPKEIIKFEPSLYTTMTEDASFTLFLYEDSDDFYRNRYWLTRQAAFGYSIVHENKIRYTQVFCDTVQEAFDLAIEGAMLQEAKGCTRRYKPQVRQVIHHVVENNLYPTTNEGFSVGELNCIIASQGTGKSMTNAYIQARNADALVNAMQGLNLDDISL